MPDIAYVNGQFSPLKSATISINDRSVLFGDSVYEVIVAYGTILFLFEEHITRLRRGCEALRIPEEPWLLNLENIVTRGLKDAGYENTVIYIQITRGVEPRNLVYGENLSPTIIVTFRELPTDRDDHRTRGVKVCTKPDIRWSYCNLKTTNLLGNVLMKNEAAEEGFFEALLVKPDGTITEGCSSSLFSVIDGTLHTPPLSPSLLPGVNREFVISVVAPELGITVREEPLSLKELHTNADELFLTSTTFLGVPVTQVDGSLVKDGTPGPVTKQVVAQMQAHTGPISPTK